MTILSPDSMIRSQSPQFWEEFYKNELGLELEVPPPPSLESEMVSAFRRFGLICLYLPKVDVDKQYPYTWKKPDVNGFRWSWMWDQVHRVESGKQGSVIFETLRLPEMPRRGRWIAVETIAPCHDDDPQGYGNGEDRLLEALGLRTRFQHPYTGRGSLSDWVMPEIAKLLHCSPKAVTSPSVYEFNLIGNIFRCLKDLDGSPLPDFAQMRSGEWARDAPYFEYQYTVAGLKGVGFQGAASSYVSLGFRTFVFLNSARQQE